MHYSCNESIGNENGVGNASCVPSEQAIAIGDEN